MHVIKIRGFPADADNWLQTPVCFSAKRDEREKYACKKAKRKKRNKKIAKKFATTEHGKLWQTLELLKQGNKL